MLAKRYNLPMISPTWLSFDPVQWKLWSRDKRTYMNLFKNVGLSGFRKMVYLNHHQLIKEEDFLDNPEKFSDRDGYVEVFFMKGFEPILNDVNYVREALIKSIRPKQLQIVNDFDFNRTIAVHIRLGDYGKNAININWYKTIVQQIHEKRPDISFLIFSDGRDQELQSITKLSYVKRQYFGSSISDLFAISKCCALIGSHSTFTDWGGYLGQLPSILPKVPHYGSFLLDKKKEIILNRDSILPNEFFEFLR